MTASKSSVAGLTICGCSGLVMAPVSIIADVSGPEDAVQKPQSHPIRCMLSFRLPTVEQFALVGASLRLVPGFHNGLTTAIWANVMPKEWCLGVIVVPLVLYQTGTIRVDSVVHGNCLILRRIVNIKKLHESVVSACLLAWHDIALHAEDCWCQGAKLS